jgi:putative membrane-bound dehydrogenase-like protein
VLEFAREPAIVTPTGIAVDAKGRVFAIESHTHFRPKDYAGPPADRIRRFEDTDGDGKADKITTAFEGTRHTMALAFDRDGSMLVATRREVFRLRDKDDDGTFETRATLATLDTPGDYPHNGLSGFAIDFRRNIYFGLGENLGAQYKLQGADGTTLAGGGEGGNIYRIGPDGKGLIRVATGFWNPFHMAFDAFGRLFAVDNDPDSRPPCRLLHIVQGGDYGYRFRNGRKGLHPFTAWNGELPGTLPMVAGTGEAPSGIVSYESIVFPKGFFGTLLVTSWGDHRVERFKLAPRGASFRSTAEPIVTGGEDFRPVGIAVTPGGSLFVSDWVDKAYEVHGKGRIWQVGLAQEERGAIRIGTRLDEERFLREFSVKDDKQISLRRLLRYVAKPRDRSKLLMGLLASSNPDASLDVFARDPSTDVRALAVRELPTNLLNLKEIAAKDDSAEVRAEALRRLATPDAKDLLLKALESDDPFIQQAAREGLLHSSNVADRLQWIEKANPSQRVGLLLTLRAAGDPKAEAILPKAMADPDPDVRFLAIEWVGEERLARYRDDLVKTLASGASTRLLFESVLAALERIDVGVKEFHQEFAGEEYVAKVLLDPKMPANVRRRALRMLRPDHPALTLDRLKIWIDDDQLGLRLEAVRTLRDGALADRTPLLSRIARDETMPVGVRAEAIVGLTGDDDATRKLLLDLAAGPEPTLRREALRSLRGATLTADRRSRLADAAKGDDDATQLLAMLDGHADPLRRPANTDLDAWLKLVAGPGDPAAGGRIFFHPRGAGCYRCHQVDGRGGRLGPDLSETGRALTLPRLVQSILEPSREVAPRFVSWLVEKNDGTTLTGALIDESPLGDQTYATREGKAVILPAADVAARKALPTSIMPDDLARTLTPRELRDLIAFLRRPRE